MASSHMTRAFMLLLSYVQLRQLEDKAKQERLTLRAEVCVLAGCAEQT